MNKIKNYLINIILLLVTLEFFSFIALIALDSNSKNFEQLFYGENNNVFVRTKCNMMDRLQSHPYLGFVNNPACVKVNNIGLLGTDVEYLKKENTVRIGIFGGSVAAQFAGMKDVSSLEYLLNKCYSNNKNITYVVNNFSDGAWKYPHQVIALSLYKDFIDIAISIEGFNEVFMYEVDYDYDFSIPSDAYIDTNPSLHRYYYLFKAYSFFDFLNDTILSETKTIKFLFFFIRNSIEFLIGYWPNNGWKENWELPNELDNSQWNRERHAGFLRDFEGIAQASGIASVFVLQPSPIYKDFLTEKELKVVTFKGYHNQYQKISDVMHKNVSRLLDLSALFSKSKNTVFGDSIHFVSHGRPYSFGNKKMSETIAEYLHSEGLVETGNECSIDTAWQE